MVTNCDIPSSIASYISVIIPVHQDDLILNKRQWFTRVLINGFLPFNYSFITDTHVFPCYKSSYSELFTKFKQSDVDISISKRKNTEGFSGGAILSRWGRKSSFFWKKVVEMMLHYKIWEDQYAMRFVMGKAKRVISYRQLSSNMFFASHGINKRGEFEGAGNNYRSSIVVTGPIRWIHGNPVQCSLMNGKHDEHVYKHRAFYLSGKCPSKIRGQHVIFSEEEMRETVKPCPPPKLLWNNDTDRGSDSLFWYLTVC